MASRREFLAHSLIAATFAALPPRDRVHRFNEQRRAFATKEYSWPAGRVAHLTPA